MALRVVERSIRDPTVRRCLRRFLEENVLASFATVDARSRAHINTAYFAWGPDWSLYYYSYPNARHSRNVGRNPSMAVTVFDSHQVWGRPDRGVQLFGSCTEARGTAKSGAERWYAARFPEFARWRQALEQEAGAFPLRPYRFRARSARLFDERNLGDGLFVDVRLR